MATGGRELILGGRQDAQFGPVVLVGMGGVFVEIQELDINPLRVFHEPDGCQALDARIVL